MTFCLKIPDILNFVVRFHRVFQRLHPGPTSDLVLDSCPCIFQRSSRNLPRKVTLEKLRSKQASGSRKSTDIEAWVQSSASGYTDAMDSGDIGAGPTWHTDEVSKDWTGALKIASSRLMTSSTRTRLDFLRDELLPLAKRSGACASTRTSKPYLNVPA